MRWMRKGILEQPAGEDKDGADSERKGIAEVCRPLISKYSNGSFYHLISPRVRK